MVAAVGFPRLVSALRRVTNRTLLTTWRALLEFVDDRGHRDAAQIAFFAILSAVPLGLLLVGAFGLAFEDAEVRERVVITVFEQVPLSTDSDRVRIERTVVDALSGAGDLGPIPILLLLAAASGVMGALRHAINQAWDIEQRPPLLRRKALDLALVLGGTLVLGLSLSLTATRRAARVLDDEDGGGLAATALDALSETLPFIFTRSRSCSSTGSSRCGARGSGRSGRGRWWPLCSSPWCAAPSSSTSRSSRTSALCTDRWSSDGAAAVRIRGRERARVRSRVRVRVLPPSAG